MNTIKHKYLIIYKQKMSRLINSYSIDDYSSTYNSELGSNIMPEEENKV